jgi:hypothetical protein
MPQPNKKRVTRGEKLSAKAELEMLSNPWSGDAGLEAFQEQQRRQERPVLDAAKKMRLGWSGLALGGKNGRSKAENWNELTNKMETPTSLDSKAVKALKVIGRATPIPLVAGAVASGMTPIIVYPELRGAGDFVETVVSESRKNKDYRKDVKVLAKSNRKDASLYEQRAGEIVRAKYEARGLKQEDIDKQKYGAQQTTYASNQKTLKKK